jgi:hypothetical protein
MEEPRKLDTETLLDDAEYWIKQFDDSPIDDVPPDVFPPGYGDDVYEAQ